MNAIMKQANALKESTKRQLLSTKNIVFHKEKDKMKLCKIYSEWQTKLQQIKATNP